jgi:hypothetical protein
MDLVRAWIEHRKSIASLFWYVHVFDAKIPEEADAWICKMGEGSGLDKKCLSCTIAHRLSLGFLALEHVQQEPIFLICFSFKF